MFCKCRLFTLDDKSSRAVTAHSALRAKVKLTSFNKEKGIGNRHIKK